MIEKLNPMFIRIPNVIMYDTKIVPNAKYLYGIIDMLSYYTDTITNEELCLISQISHNSIEKYLKQLKENKYIEIERKRSSRKITPLIPHSLEIQTQKNKEKENEQKLNEKKFGTCMNRENLNEEEQKREKERLMMREFIKAIKSNNDWIGN